MSPNPGEPEHELRGWTHAICAACWTGRNPFRQPVTVAQDKAACCFCGVPTQAGIYVRQNALEVHRGQT